MTVKAALEASQREGTGKSVTRKMRANGQVPAVVYGTDQETIPLTLNAHDTLHLFENISVDNTIINLDIDGLEEPLETLVREIQMHPYRHDILHVDFLAIQRGVAIEVEIPVHFTGQSIGVRDNGGVLDVILHDLRVRCVPADIPEEIVVDITELDVGDSIHVEDIEAPEGVEFVTEGIRTVCAVNIPKLLVVDEEEEEEGLTAEELEALVEAGEISEEEMEAQLEEAAEEGEEGEAEEGAEAADEEATDE